MSINKIEFSLLKFSGLIIINKPLKEHKIALYKNEIISSFVITKLQYKIFWALGNTLQYSLKIEITPISISFS